MGLEIPGGGGYSQRAKRRVSMSDEEILVKYFGGRPQWNGNKLFKIGDMIVQYSGGQIWKVGGATIQYSGGKLWRVNGETVQWSGNRVWKIGDRQIN